MPSAAPPSQQAGLIRLLGWVLAGVSLVALVLCCVLAFPRLLSPPPTASDLHGLSPAERLDAIFRQRQIESDIRNGLFAGLAGLGVAVGGVVALRRLRHDRQQFMHTIRQGQQQLEQGRQAQITERFTRAIDQLGGGKPEIVLGGIYALERIAHDAADEYRATIAEVLAAYIRTHSPWPPSRPGQYVATAPLDQVRPLRERATTVQVALTVLDRGGFAGAIELDLTRTDLRRANLQSANLKGANLRRANLAGANLNGANLIGTGLPGADLQHAKLARAKIQNANLEGARLQHSHLYWADLQDACLGTADLQDALLMGANRDCCIGCDRG